MINMTQTVPALVPATPEFREYTAAEKSTWAKKNAADNAKYISDFLGFPVSPRLPFVLLQAARDVCAAATDPKKFITRLCQRGDHYQNCIKVLATAIVHYDLAANLVATRDKMGKLQRCENDLFTDRLGMAPRTVDNVIATIKEAGLYLSFEQRESTKEGHRGRASIKRLNMGLFNWLGLGREASVQRANAKQRQDIKKVTKTPTDVVLDSYRTTAETVRVKRVNQRAEAATARRVAALADAQKSNRTAETLALLEQGMTREAIQAHFDKTDDIPY
ncbi:hypothetical protein [Enterovibrio norvegicus]|uniref:hypothetical protein n=1 Tax=Enterovibrio norvegicus TaxID=188144 RepID=UPI000C8173D8|nr:hypothetical protein [Enterovibrio norvegicus]PMN73140.1 hypothetical protein BCT27_12405 [Enterovibrio norvegicus]